MLRLAECPMMDRDAEEASPEVIEKAKEPFKSPKPRDLKTEQLQKRDDSTRQTGPTRNGSTLMSRLQNVTKREPVVQERPARSRTP